MAERGSTQLGWFFFFVLRSFRFSFNVPSSGFLVMASPYIHALGFVFVVQESYCVWKIKFQTNSFSSLTFEFD